MNKLYNEMSKYLFNKKYSSCTLDEKSEVRKHIQEAIEFYKNKKHQEIIGKRFK